MPTVELIGPPHRRCHRHRVIAVVEAREAQLQIGDPAQSQGLFFGRCHQPEVVDAGGFCRCERLGLGDGHVAADDERVASPTEMPSLNTSITPGPGDRSAARRCIRPVTGRRHSGWPRVTRWPLGHPAHHRPAERLAHVVVVGKRWRPLGQESLDGLGAGLGVGAGVGHLLGPGTEPVAQCLEALDALGVSVEKSSRM